MVLAGLGYGVGGLPLTIWAVIWAIGNPLTVLDTSGVAKGCLRILGVLGLIWAWGHEWADGVICLWCTGLQIGILGVLIRSWPATAWATMFRGLRWRIRTWFAAPDIRTGIKSVVIGGINAILFWHHPILLRLLWGASWMIWSALTIPPQHASIEKVSRFNASVRWGGPISTTFGSSIVSGCIGGVCTVGMSGNGLFSGGLVSTSLSTTLGLNSHFTGVLLKEMFMSVLVITVGWAGSQWYRWGNRFVAEERRL